MGREFDFYGDLEKKLNETIDRELDQLEDIFVGESYLEDEEVPKEPKRGPGRPKGVRESAPRKKSNSIGQILERTLQAISHLQVLGEMIRKSGSHYILYAKTKDPKTGKRKRLGSFGSKVAAQKREKQIQAIKHAKED